jgi:hypothetical protein
MATPVSNQHASESWAGLFDMDPLIYWVSALLPLWVWLIALKHSVQKVDSYRFSLNQYESTFSLVPVILCMARLGRKSSLIRRGKCGLGAE